MINGLMANADALCGYTLQADTMPNPRLAGLQAMG